LIERPGNIELETHIPDDTILAADSGKLRQVLLNVLLNAHQSIDGEGTVSVSASPEGPDQIISVRDTGCGIPAEALDRVFWPFYTTKEKGTGLGLAVAAQIMESHGGALEVESAVGKGSTFRIRLPKGDE
jgi:signal transduction histidine kinase